MLALSSVAIMTGLTFLLASMLVLGNRWLHVEEDPRIDAVERMLPHTNCGACGYPGCHAFADALVRGESLPSGCTVSSPAEHEKIAAFLGVDVGAQEKRVARLACAGGNNVARNRAHYEGLRSCAAAALVAGGGKACFWGCLGIGDCETVCDFDAISMDAHRLPFVNEDRCTACGDCVEACPKDLFSLQPISQRLWVACSSLAEGDAMLEDCEVACTGCARCAMDAPNDIEMKHNLPVIHARQRSLSAAPTQRCPTGAIVWLEKDGRAKKGPAAMKVIRHGELRDSPS